MPLPNGGLSLTLVNPVFDTESIARAYSFPFNFTLSPRLSNLLNHPARLDAKPQFTYLDAKLYIENQEFLKGKFSIYKGVNRSIEGNLQSDSRLIFDDAEKIKIRNLIPDVAVTQLGEAFWSFRITAVTTGKDYAIEVNGTAFDYEALSTDTVLTVGAAFVSQITAAYPQLVVVVETDAFSVSFLVIKDPNNQNPRVSRLSTSLVYTDSKTYMEVVRDSFNAFVKADFDTPNVKYAWNYVENTNLYGTKKPATFNGIINDCSKSSALGYWFVPKNDIENTDNEWQHTFSPFVKISYVFDVVKTALGLERIEGDFTEWDDILKLSIDNDYTCDNVLAAWFWISTAPNFEKKYCNAGVKTIPLKSCVPDWTAKEFITSIAESFQLDLIYKNNILTFQKKRNKISDTPQDWSLLIEPNQERQFVKPEGFTLKYKTYDNDAATASLSYIKGDGVKPIDLPVGIPAELVRNNVHFITKAKEKGDTSALRLFFDYGDVNFTLSGITFTYRMSGIDSFAGVSFSLILTETDGLYKTFREGIDDITADGWEIVKLVNIKAADVFKIQNWDHATVYFYDNEGCAVNAVIKKIEIKISDWAVQTAKVTFVKY
jgi:hypothetical protein